uniref:Thylakoid lumenal 17.4 kDa protein, chloroplastic n=1 Tax=Hanusia phi TaxID=3032 RepID=A0A7S0EIA2_9CRYP
MAAAVVSQGDAFMHTSGASKFHVPSLRSKNVVSPQMAMKSPIEVSGKQVASLVAGAVLLGSSMLPLNVEADSSLKFNFPPIDRKDKDRCTFRSSAIGQANAARDKLYDLRECSMSGKDATGFDLAGALMQKGDFSKVKFKDAVMSKVFANEATFDGADFSNAVMDRGTWRKSSFKGAIFANAVLSGSEFEGSDLTDADFSDTYMGDFDNKKICKNPTLQGTNPVTGADTRASASCRK